MVPIAGYKTKELTQFAGPGHLAHNWLKQRRERQWEEGREGEKEEGRELPMMQAESRMVPSEGRSHTRLQQALHCVYPTAANVASTTTNYSQVKDLTRWTFCKRKSPFSFTSNCRNPQWISHTTATLVVSTCVCLPAKRHWPWHLAKKKNLQKAEPFALFLSLLWAVDVAVLTTTTAPFIPTWL